MTTEPTPAEQAAVPPLLPSTEPVAEAVPLHAEPTPEAVPLPTDDSESSAVPDRVLEDSPVEAADFTPVEESAPTEEPVSAVSAEPELAPTAALSQAATDDVPEEHSPEAAAEPEVVAEEQPAVEVLAAAEEPEAEVAEETIQEPEVDVASETVEESEPEARETVAAAEGTEETEPSKSLSEATNRKRWYVIKVQSNREDSIKNAIERRVKIEGLEEFFGRILIPTEKVTEARKKDGKRVIKERKKFPGYIMAEVEFNDRILYLFRETSGVGDFVGGGSLQKPPQPMSDREVELMLRGMQSTGSDEAVPAGTDLPVKQVKPPFERGDRVRVRDGIFENMEGEVKDLIEPKDAKDPWHVRVELTIFGRPTSVDLESWQVDAV